MPAARTSPLYPFTPKSITPLRPGQFWAIPLHNGRFACGRVLQINRQPDQYALNNTRSFLAGLMSWTGDTEPTSAAIAGSHLLDQGQAHIKTIITTGGQILGHRPLDLDNIQPLLWVTHRGGDTVYLYQGLSQLRPATDEERTSMPLMSVWGYQFIDRIANRELGSS